jgi:membrane protein involved in colicin uptake
MRIAVDDGAAPSYRTRTAKVTLKLVPDGMLPVVVHRTFVAQ